MANKVVKIHPYSSPVTIGGDQIADLGVSLVDGAGIAVIGEDVYVSDFGDHTILKGRIGGDFVVFAGQSGTNGDVDGALGTNLLDGPGALCVDGSKNLWVVDVNNGKIKKIDSNGNVHTICATPVSVDGQIAVDAAGNVLLVDNN
jgi:sugar lactone lactonase YvrE